MITQERIKHFYYYDETAGGLYHNFDTRNKTKDQRAGYKHSRGYRHVLVDRFIYKEHILVWVFFNESKLIDSQIDHINNIRDDNRIENLRLSDKNTNQHNRGKNKNNSSGYKGVHKHGNKWYVQIMCKRKVYRIGIFDTPQDAALAYNNSVISIHGEFAKLNVI